MSRKAISTSPSKSKNRPCRLPAQVANDNALIWASDYPHERDQRDFSHDIPNLINRKDVSDELKRKIFWDNPLRFYPRLKARVEKGEAKAVA